MATGTVGTVARQYRTQQIHYLRKGITIADNNTTVDVGWIPAGAQIVKPISGLAVAVAFDSTTNTVDIGPSTDTGTNLWMTAGALTSLNFIPLDELVSNKVSVDTLVQAYVLVSNSGVASVGDAEIIIAFIPDNDK